MNFHCVQKKTEFMGKNIHGQWTYLAHIAHVGMFLSRKKSRVWGRIRGGGIREGGRSCLLNIPSNFIFISTSHKSSFSTKCCSMICKFFYSHPFSPLIAYFARKDFLKDRSEILRWQNHSSAKIESSEMSQMKAIFSHNVRKISFKICAILRVRGFHVKFLHGRISRGYEIKFQWI